MKAKDEDGTELQPNPYFKETWDMYKQIKQNTNDLKWILVILSIILLFILSVIIKIDMDNIPTKVVEIWKWTRGLE